MVSSADPQPDHYAALGLGPDATSRDIEEAFHARVREHLQQSNVSEAPLRQKARQVGQAYETLRDPERRRAYDESRIADAEAESHLGRGMDPAERPIMFVPPVDPPPTFPEPEGPEPWTPEPEQQSPIEPQAEDVPPTEAEKPITPEPAIPFIAAAAARPAEVEQVVEPTPIEDASDDPEPELDDNRMVVRQSPHSLDALEALPREARGRSRVHAGAIGAGALVIALGLAGLLMMRPGSGSHQATGTLTGPTAPGAGDLSASASGTLPPAADSALPVATGTIPPAERSAVGTATEVPPDSNTAAAVAPSASTNTTDRGSSSGPELAQDAATPTQPADSAATAASSASSGADPLAPVASSPAAASPPAPARVVAAPAPPPPQARRVKSFPRWLGGGIMNSDNRGGRYEGTVSVRFTVQPNGRAVDCRPVASSGNSALDSDTCALVQDRLRFSPALDAQNQPIAAEVRTTYTWGRTRRRR
jgi:TonB family protein